MEAYVKLFCMVGRMSPNFTSSVVVTFVQAMQRETICPAARDKMNCLVQILFHRAHRLWKKAQEEE